MKIKNLVIVSLLAIAASSCGNATKKQAENAENVICNEYQQDDGYTIIKECSYKGMTFKQVYDIVKETDKHLKSELPAEEINYKIDNENEFVEIAYYYPLDKIRKILYITLFYNGGETEIEIVEYKGDITSKIIYSAD